MKKIALLPNPLKDPDFSKSAKICDYLTAHGACVIAETEFKDFVPHGVQTFTREEAIRRCECVVALGGDGTLLRVARPASFYGKPILGINYGKIGYMAELEYNEIDKLSALIDDDFVIENRLMIDVSVTRGGKIVFSSEALNDAVISKGIIARLIDLDVKANADEISFYRADGIIISTPTGSTGYSLSAGGPVLEPSGEALILTPICPHSLGARPIVFAADSVIEVTMANLTDKDALLTIDGYDMLRLEEKDIIRTARSKQLTRLIKIKNINFYKILNHKLVDGDAIR